MVWRLNIDSVQIWSTQASTTGILYAKLRASISQRPVQTQQMSESAEVGTLVERMLQDQRGIPSIPVTSLFSQYPATILEHQDCRYWTTYFFSQDALLPPTQGEPQAGEIPTPLQLVFSLFTRQPLPPSHTRTISFLVEQSLRIASSRGLLLMTAPQFSGPIPAASEKTIEPPLAYLIPERTQATEIEQARNSFNSTVVITEKKIRQIYSLIDGKKNIAELAFLTRMHHREVLEALQALLSRGHIKLREPGGRPVELSSFLQSF